MHIHTKWWRRRVTAIYIGQYRADGGPSVMHRIDFQRLDDDYDKLLDLVDGDWMQVAPRVRKVCTCCSEENDSGIVFIRGG